MKAIAYRTNELDVKIPVFIKIVFIIILFVIGFSSFSFGQEPDKLTVTHLGEKVIQTKPKNSITSAFRVKNISSSPLKLAPEVSVPEGWQVITQLSPFELQPGQQTIQLIGIFIPLRVEKGDYDIFFAVNQENSSLLYAEDTIPIRVLLSASLELHKIDVPTRVVAGDEYQAHYLVINDSNAACKVKFQVESKDDSPLTWTCDKHSLQAGESASVNVTVQTSKDIHKKTDHFHSLTVTTEDFEGEDIRATTVTNLELIPMVSGEKDYFHRLPLKARIISVWDNLLGSMTQLSLSGSGTLNEHKDSRVDFLFQGPGENTILTFGQVREEYRFRFQSPMFSISAGDQMYYLSKLTEYGHYGRGIEGIFQRQNFSLRAYYDKSHVFIPRQNQVGFQLGFHDENKDNGLFINYVYSEKTDQPEDQMLSFHSEIIPYKDARLTVEGALGQKGNAPDNKIGKAFWVEMSGRHKWLNYRMNVIRSTPTYPGYYQGIDFNSASLSLAPFKWIELNGAYYEQKRNMQNNTPADSLYARNYNFGCRLKILDGLLMFIENRNRTRNNYMGPTPYNYEDNSTRLGVNTYWGPLMLMATMDRGKTNNKIVNKTADLNEYIGSLSFRPSQLFSFNGYVQWRDQKKNFTGDDLQNLTISFDAMITIGRTSLMALGRTSFHREFYDQVLNDYLIAQEFITNRMSLAEISLKHQFKNNHSLGLHVRQVLSPHSETAKNIVGFIDYTMPINVPVSRKPDRFELSGQVFDSEKNNEGIKGVIIRANDRTTITDKKGHFTFHGLQSGQYYLAVDRGTLQPEKITAEKSPMEIALTSHKKNEWNISVVSKATFSGRVQVFKSEQKKTLSNSLITENEQNKMVVDRGLVNVMIELRDASEIRRQMTDTGGWFHFEDVRPGEWVVNVFPLNLPENHFLEKETITLTIAPGASTEIVFKVLPVQRLIRLKNAGMTQEITVVSERPEKASPVSSSKPVFKYTVQVASFTNNKNAEGLKNRLMHKFRTVTITQYPYQNKTYYLVWIGSLSYKRAQEIKESLKKEGVSALIIREF